MIKFNNYKKEGVNDSMYRPSGGALGISTGLGTIANIKGNTVAWNQLLNEGKLVDMGLPSGTLWASCNIDITQADGFAASPFQYECSFFSWGNVDGHNPISTSTFDYNFGSANAHEPWYDGQPYGETQGNTLTGNIQVGDTYDAARVNVGALWRMPSSSDFVELLSNTIFIDASGTEIPSATTDKRVYVNGIRGLYLESKNNGNRLFFACSGNGAGRSWNNRGANGYFWSSSWDSARFARFLNFNSSGVYPQYAYPRYNGFPVRPVITPSASIGDGKDGHKFALSSNNGNITDVTLIYGAGNEPSSVAQFEQDYSKWFGKPLTYEDYDAGSLRSVQLDAIKTTGFNQFNPTTNKAKVIGGIEYQITGTYTSITLNGGIITPDTNGKFTPTTTGELQIVGGSSSDTCIHIAGHKDNTYEPYEEHVAPIPVTTLKGKLNGEGESVTIFPDGMNKFDSLYTQGDKTYAIVGGETRAYQEGDATSDTMVTDGVAHTYVALATPLVYEVEGFTLPKTYLVDGGGTEEQVQKANVQGLAAPINTIYNNDVAKIIKGANTPIQKVYKGTTLIWEKPQ